jgi:hypothetical protein
VIFEDFNLDGKDDFVVSENYVGFPPHKLKFLKLPGRFLIHKTFGKFAETGEQGGVMNTGYSITTITADFNKKMVTQILCISMLQANQKPS